MGFLSKLKPKSPKKLLKSLKPTNPKELLKNPMGFLGKELSRLSPLENDPVLQKLGLSGVIQKMQEQKPQNPFAQAMQNAPGTFVPGFGYTNRQDTNPFQSAMSQIPQGFFASPQAQEMLAQAIGLRQQAPPRNPVIPYFAPWSSQGGPGPAVTAQTLMGQVGGLGNGGGKMGLLPYK